VVHRARGFYALWQNGDVWTIRYELEAAVACFERAGARSDWLNARVIFGSTLAQSGDVAEGAAEIQRVIDVAAETDAVYTHAFAVMELGLIRSFSGRDPATVELLASTLERLRGSARLTFHALHGMAIAALACGDFAAAREHAAAAAALPLYSVARARAVAVEAQALVKLGRVDEAVARAREGIALQSAARGSEVCEGHNELALAEALEAAGDLAGARAAAEVALATLQRALAFAPDAAARARQAALPTPNGWILAAARRLGLSAAIEFDDSP
jgi:tetratricopeptide (TPR) repeat protein